MDQNSIKLDLLKIKLKDLVSRKIVDMLVKKEFPYKEIQDMAIDLTETLIEVKTREDFVKLVDSLDQVYPYLKNESNIIKAELGEVREKMVIGKLENYFKNLSPN